jgi:uncharacterized membrane protein
MAVSLSLLILGLILLGIGGYIINKTRSGKIGFFAGILILLGLYLLAVGFGILPPLFTG